MVSIKLELKQQDEQTIASYDGHLNLGKRGYLKCVCNCNMAPDFTTLIPLIWMHHQSQSVVLRMAKLAYQLDFVQEESPSAAKFDSSVMQ